MRTQVILNHMNIRQLGEAERESAIIQNGVETYENAKGKVEKSIKNRKEK